MKNTLNFLLLLIGISGYAQETFNFDFEKTENNKPVDWVLFGSTGYTYSVDTLLAQSGQNSAVIEYNGDAPDFKAWSYTIPAKYQGSKIKLTGFLKTENVTDGYAGLWLRIDPGVAFDNMQGRGISGTTDWTEYEVELDYKPDQATQIVLGGLLVGKGKMWVDNLQVMLDGVRLEDAPLKELLPAEKDKEFDGGSGIEFPELEARQINDLELLGKIWGFLKYHHPEIGKGNYNWDYELFRILPEYLKIEKPADRGRILLNWIDKYGEIAPCKTCQETTANAILKPDHSWIGQSSMSEQLKKKLKYIQENRHQGGHFYIGMAQFVGNPEFRHENQYTEMPYPDAGFRLLALYKYWNIIHYFFPNKHLMDKDWNQVLKAYIPTFIKAKNELEYELAAVQLIGDIQDTHANLWGGNNAINEWKGKYYPPVHLRFIENKLLVVDYYNPELQAIAGLEIGDVITEINEKNIDEIVRAIKHYYPASNEAARLRDISINLLRSNQKEIKIKIVRDKTELTKKLILYERDSLKIYNWYRPSDELCYKLLDNNIGYVTLNNIKSEDIEPIKETFKNTRGIIIDIRNYPSTFVPFLLGSFFISKPTAFVKFTAGSVNNPGEFTFTEPLEIENVPESYKGKLVVLVNELSQSSAEYTAMAFRAGDITTIVGSTTAGADGNVSTIYLPGGLRTLISGIGVYYPDGTETQRIGIVPDVEVKPTIAGIRSGKDEVLEKAIEVINQ